MLELLLYKSKKNIFQIRLNFLSFFSHQIFFVIIKTLLYQNEMFQQTAVY